ncbi:unnamed protein product [Paramecium pentaurelia]|uniref:Uncharacterized protein n=1 Tax=Paramecium pentaurelia TaxID=43138 RepID=A0A8S1TK65_9CILI|nr:unnamed protein product [Paramecium pentaurelia]
MFIWEFNVNSYIFQVQVFVLDMLKFIKEMKNYVQKRFYQVQLLFEELQQIYPQCTDWDVILLLDLSNKSFDRAFKLLKESNYFVQYYLQVQSLKNVDRNGLENRWKKR